MGTMDRWFEVVNAALFHNVSTPVIVLAVFCVAVIAATVAFAVHEIRNDLS